MTDEPNYPVLRDVVRQIVFREEHPTAESVRVAISSCMAIPSFRVSDVAAETLAREIESQLDITMTLGAVVQEEFAAWYDASKAHIDPYYWDRYRRLLEQKGFPRDVMAKLDQVTDRITGLLGNPENENEWDRRGMVVGHVQSGKTANYTGLVCKAADAGYKLVVIIAGIHNNLRNQTQQRIDEGFVGRDSAGLAKGKQGKIIGAGKFDQRHFPLTVTNSIRDFNKATAEIVGLELRALNVPAILVIKKNQSTLKNLISWLKEHNAKGQSALVDAPMLLIDDEADNASINTSANPANASRINGLIRELLNVFRRKCYVGYTATPFANIFIDPDTDDQMLKDDLFPRDFIVSLDPPSNYFSALRIFGPDRDNDILRELVDNNPHLPLKHNKTLMLEAMPDSLEEAIRSFIVARAIRLLRGEERAHNSMLINASRFTDVQKRLRDVIHDFMQGLVSRVRLQAALAPEKALKDDVILALHGTWEREFGKLEFSWPQVQSRLLDSAAPIRVEEVNSRSTGNLSYADHEEHGLNVIAVGGFSLSRGLTLEGLTVSYFLRNSVMYDTLLQMGRWFGYRPGYEDVCRIWMPPEAIGWYEHITESIEELREELRRMEQAGLTPKDFGLKVRSHPDTLIVTAKNKMGSSQELRVSVSLANRFIETARLLRAKGAVDHNLKEMKRLVQKIDAQHNHAARPDGGPYLWSGVPAVDIIEFVKSFRNDKASIKTDPAPVAEFIRSGAIDELALWDVALISLERQQAGAANQLLGLDVYPQKRTAGRTSSAESLMVTNKQRVASRGIERMGIGSTLRAEAERQYREKYPDRARNGEPNYPDLIYRAVRERPLLLLHLLTIAAPEEKGASKVGYPMEAVAAWSISFPQAPATAARHRTVDYVVNTTWWRENFGEDVDDDDLDSNGD